MHGVLSLRFGATAITSEHVSQGVMLRLDRLDAAGGVVLEAVRAAPVRCVSSGLLRGFRYREA